MYLIGASGKNSSDTLNISGLNRVPVFVTRLSCRPDRSKSPA